jgi:hypothetical protein
MPADNLKASGNQRFPRPLESMFAYYRGPG